MVVSVISMNGFTHGFCSRQYWPSSYEFIEPARSDPEVFVGLSSGLSPPTPSTCRVVRHAHFAEAKVATAVNGCFVASTKRGLTPLAPKDAVEIVAPRQGG